VIFKNYYNSLQIKKMLYTFMPRIYLPLRSYNLLKISKLTFLCCVPEPFLADIRF